MNREKFKKLLKPGSVAIFNSNDIMPTNADGTMPFRQNNDIFYLSGIDQEQSILVLAPDHPDERMREILFVTKTNEEIMTWEGYKYTKEDATVTSGIREVRWLEDFEKTLRLVMLESEFVYLPSNEHPRAWPEVPTREMRFAKWLQEQYPLHKYERAAPLMHKCRAIKVRKELELMQRACDITELGFRRVLKFVKPGITEFEIEAEYLHEFVRNRSRGFAYTPIIASGANACILHYIDNADTCKAGDLILFDVGAEYANYNADMSRTIPVSGRFNERQLQVYRAVLRVKREAMKMLRPGNIIPEYHKEVGKIMESELLGLGLLDKTDIRNQDANWPAYKKYFMHGTSHHIGLDVHDVGNIYEKMEPGMVFTVEPGIYIKEEGLGVRLENDVVITEDGLEDLMANIPIEPEEIEELMNSNV